MGLLHVQLFEASVSLVSAAIRLWRQNPQHKILHLSLDLIKGARVHGRPELASHCWQSSLEICSTASVVTWPLWPEPS